MSDAAGSLRGHAAAACLMLFAAAAEAAAQSPQPVVVPAPAAPEFLSRYEFHLTADKLALSAEDPFERYSWDTHFGGSIDLVDYVAGRASMTIDYEAVLGNEFRAFDPNQGNYTLEAAASARVGPAEVVGVFHHVSRHLSDRPKRGAVAWNTLGGRILASHVVAGVSIDVDLDVGFTTQQSFVDYTWISSLGVELRRDVSPHAGVFARGTGQIFAVDGSVPKRGRQTGGMVEAGVRIKGSAGALELFAGYERRVDAYPLERVPQNWGLAGFRLVSR